MVRIQKRIPEKPKGLNFDYSNCDFPWPIIFVVCFLKNIYINYIWTTTKKKHINISSLQLFSTSFYILKLFHDNLIINATMYTIKQSFIH